MPPPPPPPPSLSFSPYHGCFVTPEIAGANALCCALALRYGTLHVQLCMGVVYVRLMYGRYELKKGVALLEKTEKAERKRVPTPYNIRCLFFFPSLLSPSLPPSPPPSLHPPLPPPPPALSLFLSPFLKRWAEQVEAKEKQMALLKQKEEEAMVALKSNRGKKGAKDTKKGTKHETTPKVGNDPGETDGSSSDDDAPVGQLKAGKP